jgi:hypothetical protein
MAREPKTEQPARGETERISGPQRQAAPRGHLGRRGGIEPLDVDLGPSVV